MKLTTVEELKEHLRNGHRNGWETIKLHIASITFKSIDTVEFKGEAFIGESLFSDDYIGLMWVNQYGNISQRSLLDMNIPENHYNDWRAFTTREEAEEYINPEKAHVTKGREIIKTSVYNVTQFEENIRAYARSNKIGCIKLVRSIVHMDLITAKYYVEYVAKVHQRNDEPSLGDILRDAIKSL